MSVTSQDPYLDTYEIADEPLDWGLEPQPEGQRSDEGQYVECSKGCTDPLYPYTH